jgi:hypothetical protein
MNSSRTWHSSLDSRFFRERLLEQSQFSRQAELNGGEIMASLTPFLGAISIDCEYSDLLHTSAVENWISKAAAGCSTIIFRLLLKETAESIAATTRTDAACRS